jgi:hypothetical protein
MATRRAIQGVLHNFLGTYTSRYTDLNGYWLFGFLVAALQEMRFDLIGKQDAGQISAPEDVARWVARTKFREQMEKSRVPMSSIKAADLIIRRGVEKKRGFVNGLACDGCDLVFDVQATTSRDVALSCGRSVFVAPHDPRVERRSARDSRSTPDLR